MTAADQDAPRYVLAIDGGSQSTKVSVVDASGSVVSFAQRGLRPLQTPQPGRAVHPDDDLWDSLCGAVTTVLADFTARGGRPEYITGVGLCSIRFCRALTDADGQLTEPVLSWMDDRVGQRYASGAAQTVRLTSASGYLTTKLTGQRVDSYAAYQGMWPIDPLAMAWSDSPDAYQETGMRREMLDELVAPGKRLGAVTAAASTATGIAEGTPVFATANDKAVEALGAGITDDQTVVLSLGTYIAAMTAGSGFVAAEGSVWTNFASRPGRYLYESRGIRRGMWTASWVRDLVMPQTPGHEGSRAINDESLTAQAAGVPAGSGGLMALLDWLPPADAPKRRGALIGFDGSQQRGAVYRSVLEGIALTMADNVADFSDALGRQTRRLVVCGGGARSALLPQIVSDVFDMPVYRPAMTDSAGLGAAICAAVGSGIYADWDSAVAAMTSHVLVASPSDATVSDYRDIGTRYRRLRQLMGGVFDAVTADRAPR